MFNSLFNKARFFSNKTKFNSKFILNKIDSSKSNYFKLFNLSTDFHICKSSLNKEYVNTISNLKNITTIPYSLFLTYKKNVDTMYDILNIDITRAKYLLEINTTKVNNTSKMNIENIKSIENLNYIYSLKHLHLQTYFINKSYELIYLHDEYKVLTKNNMFNSLDIFENYIIRLLDETYENFNTNLISKNIEISKIYYLFAIEYELILSNIRTYKNIISI
jgi:hypothetical protein